MLRLIIRLVSVHSEGAPMLRKRDGGTSLQSGVRLLKDTITSVTQALTDN